MYLGCGEPGPCADDPAWRALVRGEHGDPFALLGPHEDANGHCQVTVLAPHARRVWLVDAADRTLARQATPFAAAGLFRAPWPEGTRRAYRVCMEGPHGVDEQADPYAFGLLLKESDLTAMAAGDGAIWRRQLGARVMTLSGIEGVRFAVWAPHARRVSVVGDFNGWDGRLHPMRRRHNGGVWELFLPCAKVGDRYKYELIGPDGQDLPLKADPMARRCEAPPATASIVTDIDHYDWQDEAWMARQARPARPSQPISIYEVHAPSWRHDAHGKILDWDGLREQLIPYVCQLGFTHIELLPVSEHPFGGSWGYQPLGLYAPTARLGSAQALMRFVDACHQAGIGVIVDWVSAHFPSDEHGLACFDGYELYEHADPREGMHRDWNTLIYNYGRPEVAAYLIGNALEWIERFHIDGLRVDAVASMLYRDYSRPDGEWIPNVHGGRENLEALAFIRTFNRTLAQKHPGVLRMAEESTAWPGVTRPPSRGGLGFSHKWNMGWMHDTLSYMRRDPAHRCHHHSEMSFGLVYAFSERFVLPLSHDEVVHGKGSLLGKMPGDAWQQAANLRAYLGFMWAHPGRKLLFMGGEFGQYREWDHDGQLDWPLLLHPLHAGLQRLVGDLNHTLRVTPALYRADQDAAGFRWSINDDAANSVFAFLRQDPRGGAPLLCITNFTPVPRHAYRVGVPEGGAWRECLNTDSAHYGGSNMGNGGSVRALEAPSHGLTCALELTLPPLATLWLQPVRAA
ncbi:1,4-alpha-glucan branching protein GlgB [Oleiagrimonas sp. C23AA]|uniref:1,4-alpha-glucan branching protein GlgB n=1 Tax=Oleiagrimonas sp. C23AA TaxID=2719047 RepID=UPI001F0F08A6|nr:1,4-alpha-glucan branching protein GlgB [Oleiagrimonas sp. C23AA]